MASYNPGDLVIFNGNASPARVLEIGKNWLDQTVMSVIVRRGSERTVLRNIAPDQVQPLTMQAIQNLIGGPSNVSVIDIDSDGRDYAVTVLCESPETAQTTAA